jgi:outer membrane biosynthesis protein TonB
MKKIMLTAAGFALAGITTLYAQQQDTTRTNNRTQQRPNQTTQQPTTQQPSTPANPALQQPTNPTLQQPTPARTPLPAEQNQYRVEDLMIVPREEVPSPMRETLLGNQYKGWENSTIYQNKITGEYSLDIKNATTPSRVYRFDRTGKLIDDTTQPQKDQN